MQCTHCERGALPRRLGDLEDSRHASSYSTQARTTPSSACQFSDGGISSLTGSTPGNVLLEKKASQNLT